MSTGGDVSEQIVRDGMIVVETAAKIAGTGIGKGIEQIFALIAALIKKGEKIPIGMQDAKVLQEWSIKTGQKPKILPIARKDAKAFKEYAKELGLLYHPVFLSKKGSEMVDVVFLEGDAAKMNVIFERFNYPWTAEDMAKNGGTRDPSEKNLTGRGNGSTRQSLSRDDAGAGDGAHGGEAPATGTGPKSMVAQMEAMKAKAAVQRAEQAATAPAPKAQTPAPTTPAR